MFRALILVGALGAAACASSAPEIAPNQLEASETGYAVSEKMQEARGFLFSHSKTFLADANARGFGTGYNQAVTMLGRDDLMALIPPEDSWHQTKDCSKGGRPALAGIGELTKNHTLVIINESHSRPRHRAFIAEVVEMLRAEGFTHYAAETLYVEGAQQTEGPATAEHGWYIQDPVFARILEDIRASGMVLVAYEQSEEQRLKREDATIEEIIAVREEAQALNLIDAVLGEAPETRMVIHVGYGHAEEIREGDFAAMAARLKEKTGIDPLTIDLTACASSGSEPLLTAILEDRPVMEWSGMDVAVQFPELGFTRGRPDYRRIGGARDIDVPAALRASEGLVIIEARLAGQGDEVVPIDRLLLRPGEDIPLILPPGDYVLAAFDGKGLAAGPVEITVTP
ncbi:MAG: hypothetical protein RLO80_08385 [Hyphomonas sp.]